MFMSIFARLKMRNIEKPIMKYYDDGGRGRGNCTWGIGTKAHNGPCSAVELARSVTDADMETAFASRLREAERGVDRHVTVPLTQAQYDALVSLTYNAGVRGAKRVYKLLNEGNFQGAANEISSMTSGHELREGKRVVVFYSGLIPRRRAESAPFRNADAPLMSAAK